MKLAYIEVEGYRGYKSRIRLAVHPLTLIYGENSAGKSSLARLLPLIRRTIESTDNDQPLRLDESITKSATARDLFSKLKSDPVMVLLLSFDGKLGNVQLQYQIRLFKDLPIIETFSVIDSSGDHTVVLSLDGADPLSKESRKYIANDTRLVVPGLGFAGLRPTNRAGTVCGTWQSLIALCSDCLKSLLCCEWLGPLRRPVPRIETINNASTLFHHTGSTAAQFLYQDYKSGGKIFSRVSKWFQANCQASLDVVLGAHEFGALASLALLRNAPVPLRIPIEDAGEGMSQVLPVVVAAVMAAEGMLGENPIVVIEHPDLHMHTNAHYGIMQLLVECTNAPSSPRFIIESHSEAMITAAQLEVLRGNIRSDAYVAHYVSVNSDAESTVETIEFNEKGLPKHDRHLTLDWFSEVHKRALELAKFRVLG